MVCEHVRETNNDNNGVYSRVIYVFIMKICKVIVYTLIFSVTATSGESSSKGCLRAVALSLRHSAERDEFVTVMPGY